MNPIPHLEKVAGAALGAPAARIRFNRNTKAHRLAYNLMAYIGLPLMAMGFVQFVREVLSR